MKDPRYFLRFKLKALVGQENSANGVYEVDHPWIKNNYYFLCTVVITEEWERVSAQLFKITNVKKKQSEPADRCLTWKEQCFIKNLFYGPQEVIMQFFPAMTDYIGTDEEEFAVHLWNPLKGQCQVPQAIINYGLGVKPYVEMLRARFPREAEQDLYDVVYYLRDKLGTETFYREAEQILKPKPR